MAYRDTLKNNAIALHGALLVRKESREAHLPFTVSRSLTGLGSLVWPHVVAVPWVIVWVGRGVVWNYRIPWIPVRDLHLHSFHRGIHLLQSTPYSYLCLTEAEERSTPVPILISSKSRNPANKVPSLHGTAVLIDCLAHLI